ncbi:hypothetical protein [Streptomyces asiaticus]
MSRTARGAAKLTAHAEPADETTTQANPAIDLPATVIPNRVMSWNSHGQKLSTPDDIVDHIKTRAQGPRAACSAS